MMTQLQPTSLPEETEEPTKPTEKSIADAIFKDRDSFQSANQSQRAEFDEIYSAYMGNIEDASDKSKSQEKTLKMRTEINYIVPSVFSGEPEVEASIVGDEDKDLAYVGEKIMNHRIHNMEDVYEIIESWVKQSIGFGTSILKLAWNIELEDNEDGETKRVAIDEPSIEAVNVKDCFYNPVISSIKRQKPIFRSVIPIDEVKNNTVYDFVGDDGKLNREKVASKGSAVISTYDSSSQNQTDKIDATKVTDATIEVYEQISKDKIETVAEGKEKLVLRSKPNPYGFVTAIKLIHEPSLIPNRFEGLGVGHNTLGFSRIVQKLSNKLLDTVNFGNNPHFLIRKGAGIDKKQLVTKAGGCTEIDYDGPLSDVIIPLQVPDIKNGSLELLGRFDDDHKRASGANDMLQGAASNNTLGQDQMASSYSAERFQLINRRFKKALAELGKMLLMMEIQNIQSMDAPILKIFPLQAELANLQAANPGAKLISREYAYELLIDARNKKDLNWNIQIKGETNIAKNKAIETKQATDMFNLFAPFLPDKYKFAWMRKIAEKGGLDELDSLIPDEEFIQEQMGQIDPATGQPLQAGMMDQSQMGQQTVQQPMI